MVLLLLELLGLLLLHQLLIFQILLLLEIRVLVQSLVVLDSVLMVLAILVGWLLQRIHQWLLVVHLIQVHMMVRCASLVHVCWWHEASRHGLLVLVCFLHHHVILFDLLLLDVTMLLHHELVLLGDIHFVLQFILRIHLTIILIQRRNITKPLAARGIEFRILAHAYVNMVPGTQRSSLLLLLPCRLHLLIISIVRFRHLLPRQSRILDQRAPRIGLSI